MNRSSTRPRKRGDSFDKEYVQGQIKAHEDTVTLLQNEIDHGKDLEAKAFAGQTLPKVKAHLDQIRQIATRSGVE